MLWFWFVIGLIITICGAFIAASDIDVEIKCYSFDQEILGECLLLIGGLLSCSMLLGLGIRWLVML